MVRSFCPQGPPARILVDRQGESFIVSTCGEFNDQLRSLVLRRLPELARINVHCVDKPLLKDAANRLWTQLYQAWDNNKTPRL